MSEKLPTLRLGPIELDFPVVQAALSGYSDSPMRVIARRFGAPYTICEVMLDEFLLAHKQRRRTSHFLHIADEEHPVGGQLMGADPEQFGPAALRLVDAGFDVIDINFGCPVKKVLGRCRGGFHLGQPEVALEIIRRVRDAVPADRPVTLKMRRGVDDTALSEDRFFAVLEGAFAAGLAAVTIHGRTVRQRYVGPSDWSFLKRVKDAYPEQTILGSGDLFTADDCVRMIRQTGVDGVTAARGSIGNPWIYQQSRALLAGLPPRDAPTIFEQRDVIRQHLECAEQVYSLQRATRQLRKFGMRYADWHPEGAKVRAAFIRVKSREALLNVLETWYAVDGAGVYPSLPGIPKPPDAEMMAENPRATA